MPPDERQKLVIKLTYHYQTTLSLNVVKTDSVNVIVSTEDLFDVFVILL